ncbi:tRNA pseudouridine(13) synthase TruD [Atopomonas sediminilitoris]|uniref:tRNA pseudouridine(13) synthase TruD n=1 Tax=Atopomonas sediminilitoris TaxID=2919919 RepID=UPI001F4D6438|nr:tRNA pseudouridine(13) synthase TruD [Atopomonas sediminilitoris]MCJ8169716.1 tRNA pseudouridine(13) synthase TruD [Atopomonas sediminilitoris]
MSTELLGPYAWGGACGTARLKVTPEDFQVDEVLALELSGQGEHVWLWVEKRGLNTEDAARRIAKAANVPLRAVSYAGIKDRQALTRQWFSVHLPGKSEPDLSAAQSASLSILKHQRHSRKLQRGTHSANRFILTLRDVKAEPAQLESRLEKMRTQGVPNYYGLQRFGHNGGNLAQAREFAGRGELPEARNVRSRLLSSARSYLFNQVLAARVAAGTWNVALEGDLLAFTTSRSFFPATVNDLNDPRLAILDLHPTARLCGTGEQALSGEPLALEMAALAGEEILQNWLANAGMSHERRITRLPIAALTWHYPAPEQLQLNFVLPAGCFATAVVRELLEVNAVQASGEHAHTDF